MGMIAKALSSLADLTLEHPFKVAVATIAFCLLAGVALGSLWGGDHFSRIGFIATLVGLLTFGGTMEKMVARAQVSRIMASNGEAPFPYNSENVSRVFAAETVLIVYGTVHTTYGDKVWELVTC